MGAGEPQFADFVRATIPAVRAHDPQFVQQGLAGGADLALASLGSRKMAPGLVSVIPKPWRGARRGRSRPR